MKLKINPIKSMAKDVEKDNNYIQTNFNNLSPWRLLAGFVIVNLILINIVNFWRPFNHDNITEQFESKQNALFYAYELQHYLYSFKINPEQNAFNLIQTSIVFNNSLNKYGDLYQEKAKKLNQDIEQLVAKSSTIIALQQNIDKTSRLNKTLKQKIINNIDEVKNDEIANNTIKNLLFTIDKIDNFLEAIKYTNLTNPDIVNNSQENIESIGLEIEQINSLLLRNNNSGLSFINNNLEEIFNELNVLMPQLIALNDLHTKIIAVEKDENILINSLRKHEIGYINNLDSKTIIIFTIIFANIILLSLILFIKLSNKTKVIYDDYKIKKQILLLSHNKSDKEASKDEAVHHEVTRVIKVKKNNKNIKNNKVNHEDNLNEKSKKVDVVE